MPTKYNNAIDSTCLSHKMVCIEQFVWIFWVVWCTCTVLLGGSGGGVNSLDFYPASLKSLGCFYFQSVLTFFTKEGGDSEFAKFTVPTLKAFFEGP